MGLFHWLHILTSHSRKGTGVTNAINDGSILFKCPSKLTESLTYCSIGVINDMNLDYLLYVCVCWLIVMVC